MTKLSISKYHSLASDYVVLDLRALSQAASLHDLPKLAVALCERRGIVGADGVACLVSSNGDLADVRIFNPDGSESELCINGLRCAARALLNESTSGHMGIRNNWTSISVARHTAFADNLPAISITMPRPTLALLPPFVAGRENTPQQEPFIIDNQEFKGVTLFVPHLIAIRDRFAISELVSLGEKLQSDGRFPLGVNVSNMSPLEGSSFFMSTFERGGAGLTRSCSSALICGAAILWETESIDTGTAVTGYSEGGGTTILREGDQSVTAIANATHIYDASLEVDPSLSLIKPLFKESANMDEINAYDHWLASLHVNDLKRMVES
jgi:diaminopimelate epimerase